ncbi:unnamed protein product, partial [Didymodactylos carnosus]
MKSVEVSGYTVGHNAPQKNNSMSDRTLPTGAVDVDDPKLYHRNKLLSSKYEGEVNSHLSSENNFFPIIHSTHSHRHSRHHELNPFQRIYAKFPANQNLPPINDFYTSSLNTSFSHRHHHSPHIHSHSRHRHNHFHHHNHDQYAYDPRWWYLPVGSVHGPRQQFHHVSEQPSFVNPKWYEATRTRNDRTDSNGYHHAPVREADCRCL